jgi:hypothetical protein
MHREPTLWTPTKEQKEAYVKILIVYRLTEDFRDRFRVYEDELAEGEVTDFGNDWYNRLDYDGTEDYARAVLPQAERLVAEVKALGFDIEWILDDYRRRLRNHLEACDDTVSS